MAAYRIGKLTLTQYIERIRAKLTANANLMNNVDEVAYRIHAIAPHIPFSTVRKSYVRIRKKWQKIDEDSFAKNFEILESEPVSPKQHT